MTTDGYLWVERTRTLDAIDPAVRALEDNPGWRLIGTGVGSGGQTTLTFGWPWAEDMAPEGDYLRMQIGWLYAEATDETRAKFALLRDGNGRLADSPLMTDTEFGEWVGERGWLTWDDVREALEAAYDCDWRERLFSRFPCYPVRSVDGQRWMPADHFESVSADIRTAVQMDRDNEFCEMFDGGWEGVE